MGGGAGREEGVGVADGGAGREEGVGVADVGVGREDGVGAEGASFCCMGAEG